MNLYIVLMLLSIFIVGCYGSDEKYTTKYDTVNIDEVVSNERLLKRYVDCLLDEAPCTPDGAELKKNMVDALQTDCNKCSDKQKEGADKMIQYLIDNKPEYWTPLQDKYDPNGNYRKSYLETKNGGGASNSNVHDE